MQTHANGTCKQPFQTPISDYTSYSASAASRAIDDRPSKVCGEQSERPSWMTENKITHSCVSVSLTQSSLFGQ